MWLEGPEGGGGGSTGDSCGCVQGGGGGGGVGLGLGSCQRRYLTSPARLGPDLRLSGLTAAQTANDPRTSPRRWREGHTAVPVCVRCPVEGRGGRGRDALEVGEVPKGGNYPPPPPFQGPSLCPATVTLTSSAGFNGIRNRQ